MGAEERIAMLASAACKSAPSNRPRTWFHLRQFVREYAGDLLSKHKLYATKGSAAIILSEAPNLGVEHLGPGWEGVIRLCEMVAQHKIDRVLFFQDPDDLQIDRAENRELLRCCNEHGVPLHFNMSAALWAETAALSPETARSSISAQNSTLVLIAHDGQKDGLAKFVRDHQAKLRGFRLLATAGTCGHLRAAIPSGPLCLGIEPVGKSNTHPTGVAGGAHVVARMILDDECQHILFLIDHWPTARENGADVQLLLKAAVDPTRSVNLMLSVKAAEEWIRRYAPVT